MTCTSSIYHIDSLTIDGVAIAIEDSSAEIEGLAGIENEAKPSAGAGATKTVRKKIPTIIKAKLQLVNPADVEYFSAVCESQITVKDAHLGKRIMFSKCSFGKLGTVGKESVDVEFIANSRPVYL